MADDRGADRRGRLRRRRGPAREPGSDAIDLASQHPPVDPTPLPGFVQTAGDRAQASLADDGETRPSAATRPADQGWLPVLDDRSPNPGICPFLRAAAERERLVAPVEAPDPAN